MADKLQSLGTRDPDLKRHYVDNGDGSYAETVVAKQVDSGGNLVTSSNPFPVGSGARTLVTATVANQANISGAVDLVTATAARIGLPAIVTGSGSISLTFQTSHDNVTWKDLYDNYGNEYTVAASKATQGRSYLLPLADFASIRYLKVRTGTSGSPQTQNQSTDFTITAVA